MPGRESVFAAVVAAGALLVSSPAAAARQEKFAAGTITRIEVDLPASDELELRGLAEGAFVRIDADDRPECRIELKQDGTVLRLRYAVEPRRYQMDDCDLEVRVDAAADVEMDVELGAGNVILRDLASPLALEVGAGNVTGTGRRAGSISTGAGNISLHGLETPVRARSGAGNITLEFAAAPSGLVEIRTGVGSIDVTLPKGAAAQTQLSTGLGSVTRDIPSQQGAPTRIQASTGMGSIRLGSH